VTYVSVGDVAEVNPKFLPKNRADLAKEISFVPMAEVSDEHGRIENEVYRPLGEVLKGFTPFEDGDILVAKITPCFENGKIAHASISREWGFGSTEFHVLRGNSELVDDRYLFHFVRTPAVRLAGERRMTGSAGQKRVPKAFLEALKLPLPPLPEQKRIAAILDQADALREKRRAAIAKLDELLQSVFLDMFGDPVTNPKGWDSKKKLGDVSEIVSGITVGRKLKAKRIRVIPYLAVVNVQDRHLNLAQIKTIEATDEEIERYSLMKNDLLLTEGGDPDKLGRGALWKDELPTCIHQNHIFRVRILARELNPTYLNFLVGSVLGKRYFMKSAKQTTGIASINMTQLRNFPILMPPNDLQHRFEKCVMRVEEQKQQIGQNQQKLNDLFSSLQQRAFLGEL